MSLPAEKVNSGWRAKLHLGFRKHPGKTVLAERRREGPLAVQCAFYPENDVCHAYLLHPPGGVAGGDELNISTVVEDNAAALVTTPGASKFYHSLGPTACQYQSISVGRASLEWLPQENILFPGARVKISTKIELKEHSAFIGWEINCLGRPVNSEIFDYGKAEFSFALLREGQPLLIERQLIEGAESLSAPAGLRDNPVFATLYATTTSRSTLDQLRETITAPVDTHLGFTLVDGILVARYMGDSTESARNLFIAIWKQLRPTVISRPPVPPRIWNT